MVVGEVEHMVHIVRFKYNVRLPFQEFYRYLEKTWGDDIDWLDYDNEIYRGIKIYLKGTGNPKIFVGEKYVYAYSKSERKAIELAKRIQDAIVDFARDNNLSTRTS